MGFKGSFESCCAGGRKLRLLRLCFRPGGGESGVRFGVFGLFRRVGFEAWFQCVARLHLRSH